MDSNCYSTVRQEIYGEAGARTMPLSGEPAGRVHRRGGAARSLDTFLAVIDRHHGMDAAANVEIADDRDFPGIHQGHPLLQDPVGDVFVEVALVAKRPEIQLQRLQLDAQPILRVTDTYCGQISLPR